VIPSGDVQFGPVFELKAQRTSLPKAGDHEMFFTKGMMVRVVQVTPSGDVTTYPSDGKGEPRLVALATNNPKDEAQTMLETLNASTGLVCGVQTVPSTDVENAGVLAPATNKPRSDDQTTHLTS